MNCLSCTSKSCRKTVSCGAESFGLAESLENYHRPENQQVIRAAARLVDGGRAGTLSRIQEIVEFARDMEYRNIGIAYCYGMEDTALAVREIFTSQGLKATGVSCTVGGLRQDQVNTDSSLPGVSCSPLNQAAQLNAQKAELAVVIGLCMGHDILFNREFDGDITTLVVKDRTNEHNPMQGITKSSPKASS